MRSLGISVAVLLVLAGCSSSGPDRSEPRSRAAALRFSYVSPRYTAFHDVLGVGEARSLVKQMGVFRLPTRPEDRLPGAARAMLRPLPGEPASLNAEPDRARLLIRVSGTAGRSLHAIPERGGGVRLALTPPGDWVASLSALDRGVGLAIHGRGGPNGSRAEVFGVAADGITGVDVVIGGRVHPARFGRNGFFYELETARTPDHAIEALVIHRGLAKPMRVPLDWREIDALEKTIPKTG